MYLIDGHMHLEFGPLTKEYVLEFVKEAEKKGIDEIQILDHTNRFKEFEPIYENLKIHDEQVKWLNNKDSKFKDNLIDYINLMEEIKKMDLPVKVKYGLEVCYEPEMEETIRDILKDYKFDFLVGAIHSIDGTLYDMSFSKELLWEKYNVDDIYKRYHELLLACVDSGLFSQLAHPDTIKLFNYYPTYDLTDTYKTLCDHLKKQGMKAENNVGCYYRYNHKDMGLSDELLETFVKEGVELITVSDAHHPEDCGNYIKKAQERIDETKRRFNK